MRSTAFASLLAATLCVAFAQTGVTVQGRAISSTHGEPVANVLVTLRPVSEGLTYVCRSNSEGRFSTAGVVPGKYELRPAKPGFESAPQRGYLTVELGKDIADLEVRLTPDSVIAGRVVDSDGDPVRKALVEVQQYRFSGGAKELESVKRAQSDDRGEYRIFFLAPGRYFVRAEAPPRLARRMGPMPMGAEQAQGLAAGYYPDVPDFKHAAEVQTQPGAELDGIDLTLRTQQIFSIRGKFPDGAGGGRSALRLVERVATDSRPKFSMTFNADSFEIRNVEPGSYYLLGEMVNTAKPDERKFARQQVDVSGHDVDGVDLTFSQGVRVTGTVKLEGSTPLPLEEVAVVFDALDVPGQEQSTTAADGKFTTVDIAPGAYRVGIQGRNAYLKSVRVGNRDLADRKIDAGQISGELTVIVSADYGALTGTVTAADGKPVYNALVTLVPEEQFADPEERSHSAATSITGTFTLSRVEPGKYKAFAWVGLEPGAALSAEFRKPYADRAVSIEVDTKTRVNLALKSIELRR